MADLGFEAVTFSWTALALGDSLWAADFLIEVRSISQQEPAFEGTGVTRVPLLGGVKLPVDLRAVEINRNCRMVGGEIVFQRQLSTPS